MLPNLFLLVKKMANSTKKRITDALTTAQLEYEDHKITLSRDQNPPVWILPLDNVGKTKHERFIKPFKKTPDWEAASVTYYIEDEEAAASASNKGTTGTSGLFGGLSTGGQMLIYLLITLVVLLAGMVLGLAMQGPQIKG